VEGIELALQLLDFGRIAEAVQHDLCALCRERAGDCEADAGG
jgi:hypothetical protein